jgi:hypothetical protein
MNNDGNSMRNNVENGLYRHRPMQFLREVVTSYNDNIRLNNQHMLEYNQNMREILTMMRELNTPVRAPPVPRRQAPPIPSTPSTPSTPSIPNPPIIPSDYFSLSRSNLTPIGHTENADVYINNDTSEYIAIPRSQQTIQRRPRTIQRRPQTIKRSNLSTRSYALNRQDVSGSDSDSGRITNDRHLNRWRLNRDTNFTSMYWRLIREMPDLFNRDHVNDETSTPRGLTRNEIDSGVINVSYNPLFHSRIDTRCAISLEDFVEGDPITQIIECGHIFKVSHIMMWFERQTQCPVCRHNLRITETTTDNDDDASDSNTSEDYSNDERTPHNSEHEDYHEDEEARIERERIADEFTNAIIDTALITGGSINRRRGFDASGNVVYQYDISGMYY